MSTTTLITADEYAQMTFPETERFELVEGELVPLPSGTPRHCLIRDFIGDTVRAYLRKHPIGRAIHELDCRISPVMVRMPDLSIFLGERARQINLDEVPVPFAPDIAVEVLSPSEGAMDVNRKVLNYFSAGSQEVWVLDHENREFFVHTPAGIRALQEDQTLETPLLPGFTLDVAAVFADL